MFLLWTLGSYYGFLRFWRYLTINWRYSNTAGEIFARNWLWLGQRSYDVAIQCPPQKKYAKYSCPSAGDNGGRGGHLFTKENTQFQLKAGFTHCHKGFYC